MTININALTTGVGGLETTADASGSFSFQSDGTTIATVTSSGFSVTGTFNAGSLQVGGSDVVVNTDIGSTVQAYDAGLTSIAGLTTAANKMIYATASDTYAVTDLTAAGRAILDDADAAAQRTTLGLGTAATTASTDYATASQGTTADSALQPGDIGSTVQAYDADLTTLAGLSSADGNFIVGSATGWVVESGATARSSLGLGSAATSNTGDFATAAQGTLADSAVQPGDNISTLTNNSGFITGNQTITLSGDATGSGTTSITVTVVDDSHNHIISNVDGLQTALDAKAGTSATSNIDMNGYEINDCDRFMTQAEDKDVKLGVWSAATYGIGMTSAVTYGSLNDYAMTFCMNNEADRGFWWGYEGQTKSTGAMSLTTGGKLHVDSDITINGAGTLRDNTGEYGSIEIDGGATIGGWEGYSIGGRAVFMHNNSTITGIYNDVNNQWILYANHGGATDIRHAGDAKLSTTSGGVTVTGTCTATAFSGDGSGLTGISAGGGFSNMDVITSTGTWTNPGSVTKVKVTVVGGGGAGAAAYGIPGDNTNGGGGGAGGHAIEYISIPTSPVPVTIGAGGTTAPYPYPSPWVGTSGSTSSFGAYCSATGGAYGTGSAPGSTEGIGGTGGTGSGGLLNFIGQPGHPGYIGSGPTPAGLACVGAGGVSIFGSYSTPNSNQGVNGDHRGPSYLENGSPGGYYGNGGKCNGSPRPVAGSYPTAGAPGVILVEY